MVKRLDMVYNNKQDLMSSAESNSRYHSTETDSKQWQNMQTKSYNWHPPTDVYETPSEFIVKVEIAGMEESDFNIYIDRNMLVIRGLRNEPLDREKKAYHQVEIGCGEFTTRIEINVPLDHENSTAQYANGFLTIKIPKALPKQIKISKKD